jgi:hypothetical protein
LQHGEYVSLGKVLSPLGVFLLYFLPWW